MSIFRVWRMLLRYAFRDPSSLNRAERRRRGIK